MIKTIFKCDRCGHETDKMENSFYNVDINITPQNSASIERKEKELIGYEICNSCANEMIDIVNDFRKVEK